MNPRWLPIIAVMAFSFGVAERGMGETVFGNLGASGTGLISNSGSDIVSGTLPYSAAVGFSTGSSGASVLKLDSITLGLFYDNFASQSFSLNVHADNAGAPGSVLFTSSPVSIGAKSAYTFSFGFPQMSASTTYWVVPDAGLFWYSSSPSVAPTAQNGSAYTAAGTIASTDNRATWTASPEVNFYSLSVQAVPEPSAFALVAVGTATVALGYRRRGRRAG